ncbi:MAG: hypothetical protein IJ693_03845 [Bacteroidaceae bacterium]|nr:hypothetical protein [Bacteroidaceae bacterium]
MKKFYEFALTSAIALAGTTTFIACSSEDEVINNPNYDPVENTVKTQLAISLSENAHTTTDTRMTTATVQGQVTPVFRGIQDIKLIPYETFVPSINPDVRPLQDKVYTLTNLTAFDNGGKQNAKVYNDLAIPVGTGAFMLYGQAIKTGENKFDNGSIIAPTEYVQSAANYTFALEPIYPSGAVNERAEALLNYVKGIRAVANNVTNHTLHAYLVAFQPTAGSSASIEISTQHLWDKARAITDDATGVAAVRAAIIEQGGISYATISSDNKVTLVNEKVTGYPANLNLPDGAASIDWSGTEPTIVTGGREGMYVSPLNSYTYPAALCYRANTAIGTSNNDKVSDQFNGLTWQAILEANLYNWGQKVTGNTRSIALQNQIQYAVGRLDLQVQTDGETLYDAKGEAVTVNSDGFPISAVLVGHQKNVNFQFAPIATSKEYTIYDKVINGNFAATVDGPTGTNHTLVLETAEDMKQVNVAVEMTNNTGQDFAGKDGIVPAGGKFYLVGVLNLEKTDEITNPNNRKKVFEQDYITKALFTISKGTLGANNSNGLGAAYNVIPDLKTPQLEVAFSVNLEWQAGITFTKDL